MNTIEFLQISSAVVPEREALVEVGGSGKRVTYGEMYPEVVKLANAFHSLGIERGAIIDAGQRAGYSNEPRTVGGRIAGQLQLEIAAAGVAMDRRKSLDCIHHADGMTHHHLLRRMARAAALACASVNSPEIEMSPSYFGEEKAGADWTTPSTTSIE